MTASGARWQNWARSESVVPVRVERPTSAAATQRAVLAAVKSGVRIKAVGSGHSFSGIAVSPGVQLDLAWGGLIDVDEATARVTIAAGTRLHQLPALLAPYGLALENMGDIDRQTIAGATSTGTHGTGGAFAGLAAQIVAVTLVTGDGSVLRVTETENPELLPAVRLGLGALGILVDLTIQCVPAFLLHAVDAPEPFEAVLDGYLERSTSADHFEFYWFPHTETALTKTNTRLPPRTGRDPLGRLNRWVDDELLGNAVFRATCAAGVVLPPLVPRVNRLVERLTGRRDVTDHSHRVYVTNRTVRFHEMEYALPRQAVPDALREVRALIQKRGWRISFPLEVRSSAADDVWLSTGYGRDTGYIAVHRYFRENPQKYFADVEAIMRAHDGRPHWGKMHNLDADTLRQVYPRFDDFLAVRDRLDPERRFTNRYLERVLGP
ncbi:MULTISPECIES: D-arabinono-1,4-lactone oxidase [unclassified Cryobacterium]|uniref:D-arabinono-1,4-lactone oxidase n=1 Tax=unclassified Cryobacterium TaxID=2649013 RepID=UPI00106B8280|nr:MULTISPECIES: D-arabinono-1,4-lactone oxidase [unclassified Cryobacterium]TFC50984.1 FAD-binding protein [Cryobacterium sp. TMB3-1-2]TFC74330.1 FAD-binding protein [Cryobacterium sp. TMB3-15]TFC79843.1 FAD-binding protein [Cryobacterium sp. TMB3-10]TFD40794.1 FAD-binding protein [Cryobacterium sp. TMB3-12]